MKYFLHIGAEKTGERFLQNFLSLNAGVFLKKGIAYANTIIDSQELKLLANASFNKNKSLPFFGKKDHSFPFKEEKGIVKKLQAYKDIFDNESILFSSEILQASKVEDLDSFRSHLRKTGIDEIKVILYIRDQIGVAPALFSSLVRSGATIDHIPFPQEIDHNNDRFKNAFDYRQLIERFSLVFGESNLIVRLFHPLTLKNKSILEDFTSVLKVEWSDNFLIPPLEKKAFSNLGLALLSRVNKKIPPDASLSRKKIRLDLIRSFEDLFIENGYSLSPELHQAYEEAYAESNEWVRKHFFPERDRLFPQRPLPEPVDLGFTDKELDNIANLLADIWLERERDLLQQASLNDQKA